MTFIKKLFFLCVIFISISCASSPMIQPQINSLVVAQKFDYALKILKENEEGYGEKNKLLYLLDYGFLLHVSGQYEESIKAFERAKAIHKSLYTVSVSNELTTWLVNDNTRPFRPEDFELTFINIIQALNYAALNDFEEALVEARQVDSLLKMINSRYKSDQKNVYKEDAFARLLMGILYESSGSLSDYEDALLEYKRAGHIYDTDYRGFYSIAMPQVLKKNLLSLTQSVDSKGFNEYKEKFAGTKFESLKNKQAKATVYLIQYDGFVPIKHEASLPIPLPNGLIGRLSFPSFDKRFYEPLEGRLGIEELATQKLYEEKTELVEDIAAIAKYNLENRRIRVLAKSVLRSGAKYAIERSYIEALEEKQGETTASVFKYLSSIYNLVSEQADLRSWQSLPAEIRIAQLSVVPGEYKILFNKRKLDQLYLKPGDVRFYVVRSSR